MPSPTSSTRPTFAGAKLLAVVGDFPLNNRSDLVRFESHGCFSRSVGSEWFPVAYGRSCRRASRGSAPPGHRGGRDRLRVSRIGSPRTRGRSSRVSWSRWSSGKGTAVVTRTRTRLFRWSFNSSAAARMARRSSSRSWSFNTRRKLTKIGLARPPKVERMRPAFRSRPTTALFRTVSRAGVDEKTSRD